MSRENVEIVRHFFELASQTDVRDGDWAQLSLLAEDVVFRPISEMAEAREMPRPRGVPALDGGIVRIEDFIARADALEAAGVRE